MKPWCEVRVKCLMKSKADVRVYIISEIQNEDASLEERETQASNASLYFDETQGSYASLCPA